MHRIVPWLEVCRSTRARKAKVSALADGLRAVAADGDDDDLATAARLIGGSVLPSDDGAVLGTGFALIAAAACEAYGIGGSDLQSRARDLGDLGDALGEIAGANPHADARPGLSLGALHDLGSALTATTDRAAKIALLRDAYAKARPDHAKYLTKALLGELRIGVREGTLEDAIAAAFARDAKDVREAGLFATDPGELVILAHHDELHRATFMTGSRIAFMLASPMETVKTPMRATETVWEDKLDGVRAQLHAKPGLVRLFARGGGEVSAVFPEVVHAFAEVTREIVLDGEILAVTGDLRPRPFQALQARLNRKNPDAALRKSTPVVFFAFDLLRDGESMLDRPWAERRAGLEALFLAGTFAPHAQATEARALDAALPVDEQIDAAYAAARQRGHEGIVLKDTTARYDAGRRGSAWRKVKRALTTLDVVITRAERGHGKRASVLSDYTFAVRDGETLSEIGKAYSGLTDVEIADLTETLIASTREEQDGQRLVEPSIVLEVAFDGLQPSKRHASGYALRFPRIMRIRPDKTPREVDTLATVRAIFEAQIASGHREETHEPPARPVSAKRAEATTKRSGRATTGLPGQLGLFGDTPARGGSR